MEKEAYYVKRLVNVANKNLDAQVKLQLFILRILNRQERRLIGKMNSTEIKCPCCGQDYVGEYDICSICNWENDPIQLKKPDLRGGANKMSLTEAREAYSKGEKVL